QVDTRWLSQKAYFSDGQSRSTRNEIRSTLETSPRDLFCQSGRVDTPHGQVDTLLNLCDLNFLLDTWHPREKVDQPWILCPRTPRVSFRYLGYKYPPNGHPSKCEPFQSLQEIPLAARRFSSLFLPSWCILKPNSHLLKQEKWQLIVEEAIGAPQGSRSSRSRFL
ncbi:hypothetical protein Taro_019009, partial [Colocasia esculenta]|nr:hypothetical protein [Colocasia esculenta]